VRDIILE